MLLHLYSSLGCCWPVADWFSDVLLYPDSSPGPVGSVRSSGKGWKSHSSIPWVSLGKDGVSFPHLAQMFKCQVASPLRRKMQVHPAWVVPRRWPWILGGERRCLWRRHSLKHEGLVKTCSKNVSVFLLLHFLHWMRINRLLGCSLDEKCVRENWLVSFKCFPGPQPEI